MPISRAYVALLLCLPIFTIAERKLSNNNCQCGVKVVRNKVTVSPWIVHVHRTVSQTQSISCVGVVVTSDIIFTSRQCLEASDRPPQGQDHPNIPPTVGSITVTDKKQVGEGPSYPAVEIIDDRKSPFLWIQVGFDFSSRYSWNRPACLPTPNEADGIILVGANVSYVGAKTGVIQSLVVKEGKGCNLQKSVDHPLQMKYAGVMEAILCVTFPDGNVELEVEQPLFVEIAKNPKGSYPHGFYTYLAGLSIFIHEGKDGQKHLFFLPVKSLLNDTESLVNNAKTTWCSQPWPWLDAPEKRKRDESLDCECGISNEESKGRIVGGEDALPYEFPWMVKLATWFYYDNAYPFPEKIINCGGTIINDRTILTAAHCIVSPDRMENRSNGYDALGRNMTVKVSLHAHLKYEDTQAIQVDAVIGHFHPGYVDGGRIARMLTGEDDLVRSGEHDIALIILPTPLNFSAKDSTGKFLYRPVCLPKWGKPTDVFGRDGIDENDYADVLQKATWKLTSVEDCNKAINETGVNPETTLICAMHDDIYANPGDSGGPLIVKDETGKHTQVGVMAFIASRPLPGGKRLQYNLMANLQELLPFVDYYTDLVGAKYCTK